MNAFEQMLLKQRMGFGTGPMSTTDEDIARVFSGAPVPPPPPRNTAAPVPSRASFGTGPMSMTDEGIAGLYKDAPPAAAPLPSAAPRSIQLPPVAKDVAKPLTAADFGYGAPLPQESPMPAQTAPQAPAPRFDATSPEGIEAFLRSRMRPNPEVEKMRQGAAAGTAAGEKQRMATIGKGASRFDAPVLPGDSRIPEDAPDVYTKLREGETTDRVVEEDPDPMMTSLKQDLRPGGAMAPKAPTPVEKLLRDREARLGKQRMWQGIGEGAQDIANAFRTYAGGQKLPYSGGTERQIADEANVIPDEIIDSLNQSGYNLPKGLRYSELSKINPSLSNLVKNNSDQARRGDVDRRSIENKLETARRSATNSTRTRQLKERRDAAVTAKQEIAQGSPNAIAHAMITLMKSAGSIGALSDRDMKMIEGTHGVPGFFTDTIFKWGSGNFSPRQKEALNEMADLLGKRFNEQLQAEGDSQIQSFYGANQKAMDRHGMGLDDVEKAFRGIYGGGSGGGAAASVVTMVDSDGNEHQVDANMVDQAIAKARKAGKTLSMKGGGQ